MLQSRQENNSLYVTIAIALVIAATLLYPGLAQNLLSATGFIPHGHCYLWKPELVWLHVSTDVIIGVCYVAISTTLSFLVYRTRKEIPFHWMFLVFGAFIVACGMTHFMEVLTLWNPVYWLSGDVKLITALASISAALTLPPLVPKVENLLQTLKLAEERRKQLEVAQQSNQEQTWLKTNVAELSQKLQGQRNLSSAAALVLAHLCSLIEAQQGVFYWLDRDSEVPMLERIGSYAAQETEQLKPRLQLGEGLIGQCAIDKKRVLLSDVPSDYVRISSGLGEASPRHLTVLPVLFENQIVAIIEIASFQPFSELSLTFLDEACSVLGVVLTTIAATARTTELLYQSQALTKELQRQQIELRETNYRLEEQAVELQASESQLREQQEELQQTNDQLQQLNLELEEKANQLEERNREIEQARQALEEKAEQLALSSRYKSEFLANMSHELRTPLNSLLILANLLSQNRDRNLTEKQVEYSQTIYSAGNDLLELINDILDLAKIESGKLSIEPQIISFPNLKTALELTFQQIAQNKKLDFTIELDPQLPTTFTTDPKRLQQILKNLLSNAFKFTERGHVKLSMAVALADSSLDGNSPTIAFSVQDTGIGIPDHKQAAIFEAFQQADGTTSRKYGGTGLGLSISRELAHLLGGNLTLESQEGQGSTFTLYLPNFKLSEVAQMITANCFSQTVVTINHSQPDILDDRALLQPGDAALLIIENDLSFAHSLLEIAHQQGFKGLIAPSSDTGIELLQQFKPAAIMLDVRLPDRDGLQLLEQLRSDAQTQDIPVYVLSAGDYLEQSLQLGAIAYLQKPIDPEFLSDAFLSLRQFLDQQVKRLLVIEDDRTQAQSICELLGQNKLQTKIAYSGSQALESLQAGEFDCAVLDLMLPDMDGFELLEQMKSYYPALAIVVYTGKELTPEEETRLKRLAETIILKDARSPERLFDEIMLFLHQVRLKQEQPQPTITPIQTSDTILDGKKVLVVDDDVRNIFALTSLLEEYNVEVLYAETGRAGLQMLNNHPDTHLVLMDIMMPDMDGFEATRAIREQSAFKSLPIIALTAKAMKGDREQCLEAGASDYITKPLNSKQLISLMKVWLSA
jgi:signal transduction histidine kinase/CheY-like chemotaxis protein